MFFLRSVSRISLGFKRSFNLNHVGNTKFHRMALEMKTLPRILSESQSVNEFEYFSMKIKDLMDSEQLEYFENVIRKVENIQHPVAEMMSAKLHSPMIDLIIKLITNMVNGNERNKEINDKQKSLSNAVMLIHIGNLIHQRGIFDLSIFPDHGNNLRSDDDLILGNKIALLAGDFLLASAQMKITMMRDAEILKIISSAMCDIIDFNFVGERDASGITLPFIPGKIPKMKLQDFDSTLSPVKLEGTEGTAQDDWMIRQTLYRGYLIAKGCRATAAIAKKPLKVQESCFELSKNLYFSWQAFVDLQGFKSENLNEGEKFNLTSAPVLFHLQHNPLAYNEISKHSLNLDDVDYQTLYGEIRNGPGLEQTEALLRKLVNNTRSYLKNFAASEEKTKIEQILSDFQ